MSQAKPTIYPCWIYLKEGGKLVRDEVEFDRAVRVYSIDSDEFTEREWHDSPARFLAEQPASPKAEIIAATIEAHTEPKKRGPKPKK